MNPFKESIKALEKLADTAKWTDADFDKAYVNLIGAKVIDLEKRIERLEKV